MASKFLKKMLRALFFYDPTYVDWYNTTSFKEVGQKYLNIVSKHLASHNKENLKILDLGCHTGRTTIPLLKQGYSGTVGIDTSRMAVHTTRKTLKRLKLEGSFVRSEMEKYLKKQPVESADMVICLETLYLCPNYEKILELVLRALKKGGTFFISFRNRYYIFHNLIERMMFDDAHFVLHNKEGHIKDEGWNWQTLADIEEVMLKNNLKILDMVEHGSSKPSEEKLQAYLSSYSQDKALPLPSFSPKDILIVGKK